MRKRLLILLGLLVLIVAAFLALPVPRLVILGYVRGEPFFDGRPASYWAELLKSKESRIGATERLAEGGAAAIPVIREVMRDEDMDVKFWAFLSLEDMPHKLRAKSAVAVPALIENLKSEDPEVRQISARVLGSLGTAAKAAKPSLQELLTKEDDVARVVIAQALCRVAPESAIEHIPLLVESVKNNKSRDTAAVTLGEIGPAARQAIPALSRALRDEKPLRDVLCAKALWKVGGDPDEVALALAAVIEQQPENPISLLAGEVLAEMGPDARAAVPTLIKRVRTDIQERGHSRWPFDDALKAIDPEAAEQAGVR